MNAAAAEATSVMSAPHPAIVAGMTPTTEIGGLPVTQDVFDEARAGAERLLKMRPDELRALIARRVSMLDTELKEREARRAAIEEATAAQRVLAIRRQRARRMRRRVNIGSSLVAAMFTGFVVVSLF